MEVTKEQSMISRINAVAQNERKNVGKQKEVPQPNQPNTKTKDTETKDTEEKQEVLKVQVTKATEYFVDPEKIYNISSNVRGLALILNNEEFPSKEDYKTRTGSQVDVVNLGDLFQQLGFSVVTQQNLTRNNTLKYLIDFASHPAHASADMMVFCMSTHGGEKGKLMSSDCLEIDIEADILRMFTNENCPDLREKPKFFIFQACQGQDSDYGVPIRGMEQIICHTDASSMGMTGAPPSCPLRDPTWEDMLIAYATLPGFVSYRDHVRGTWFIESLCKVLMERSCDTNLRDMLDEVARKLKKYQAENGAKQSFKYDVIHFYKKVFFHPGLSSQPI
eukprot:GFUD01033805.1.p1 GENE.GFUD01033805.1~~GFUD01033805.1.p1  ORF type:complete len:348 (-),score=91.76 GFUD01033805.1:65-1066(-)